MSWAALFIVKVSDLLLMPPEERRYEALKERLLQVFEESETRQFQKLLGEMELGSQKPSQLLRHLARSKIPDPTLQIMWNSHLPAAVQAVLAVTEGKELDNLAVIADKVIEATRPAELSAVATSSSIPKDTAISSDLAAALHKLSVEVSELRRARQPYRGPRRRNSRRSRSRTRDASRHRRDPEWLCFYHYKYRSKATNSCGDFVRCHWVDGVPAQNFGFASRPAATVSTATVQTVPQQQAPVASAYV
ncbi:unnamed protein product, partial [Iphiclides podalirius]